MLLLLNIKWNQEFERWACGFNDGENKCSNTYTLQSFSCFCCNKTRKKKLENFQVPNIQIFWFDIWCLKISLGCENKNNKYSSENLLNMYVPNKNITYVYHIIIIFF